MAAVPDGSLTAHEPMMDAARQPGNGSSASTAPASLGRASLGYTRQQIDTPPEAHPGRAGGPWAGVLVCPKVSMVLQYTGFAAASPSPGWDRFRWCVACAPTNDRLTRAVPLAAGHQA